MNHALRWAIRFALFLSALFVLGTGAASAQDADTIDVRLPVDVCGIGVGLLGDSSADCTTAPTPPPAAAAPASTQGLVGDVSVDVEAPIRVCGIGVGETGADCSGSAAAPAPTAPPPPPAAPAAPAPALIGDVDADVAVPVDVCGIGVGVLGDSTSDCSGAASSGRTAPLPDAAPTDSADDGALVGLTGPLDVDAGLPVDVCGVGVGVLGDSSSDCATEVAGATAQPPTVVPPAVVPEPPAAPPGTGAVDLPLGLPVPMVEDSVAAALDSAADVPRTVAAEALRSWLAATGSGSGLAALAGVGLSFLLTGLVARKRGIPIG